MDSIHLSYNDFYYYSDLREDEILTFRKEEKQKNNRHLSSAIFFLHSWKSIRIFHRQNAYWFLDFQILLIIVLRFMRVNIWIKPDAHSYYYLHAIFRHKLYYCHYYYKGWLISRLWEIRKIFRLHLFPTICQVLSANLEFMWVYNIYQLLALLFNLSSALCKFRIYVSLLILINWFLYS